MIKRTLILAALALGLGVSTAQTADAGVYFRRVAPVRRVAARAVLPPYPIARRAVVGPVFRPVYRPVWGGWGFGPGVVIGVGF